MSSTESKPRHVFSLSLTTYFTVLLSCILICINYEYAKALSSKDCILKTIRIDIIFMLTQTFNIYRVSSMKTVFSLGVSLQADILPFLSMEEKQSVFFGVFHFIGYRVRMPLLFCQWLDDVYCDGQKCCPSVSVTFPRLCPHGVGGHCHKPWVVRPWTLPFLGSQGMILELGSLWGICSSWGWGEPFTVSIRSQSLAVCCSTPENQGSNVYAIWWVTVRH